MAEPIVGHRVGGEPADPLQHFYVCAACGQPVDMRDLGAVLHHEEPGHPRLPTDEAARLLAIEDRPRLSLLTGDAGHA